MPANVIECPQAVAHKKAPSWGFEFIMQRGRDSNLAAKALILLGFEDSNYPSPPNNEL